MVVRFKNFKSFKQGHLQKVFNAVYSKFKLVGQRPTYLQDQSGKTLFRVTRW